MNYKIFSNNYNNQTGLGKQTISLENQLKYPLYLKKTYDNFNVLKKSLKKAKSQHEREHVTPNLRKNKKLKKFNIANKVKIKKYYRWTLDTKLDYIFFKKLFKVKPELHYNFGWYNLFNFLKRKSFLQSINTSNHHFNYH